MRWLVLARVLVAAASATTLTRMPAGVAYAGIQPWAGDTQQLGDLNRDGSITPADAAIALKIAASGGSTSCDPAMPDAADVSGDGRVTLLDALMILQASGENIES